MKIFNNHSKCPLNKINRKQWGNIYKINNVEAAEATLGKIYRSSLKWKSCCVCSPAFYGNVLKKSFLRNFKVNIDFFFSLYYNELSVLHMTNDYNMKIKSNCILSFRV